MQMLRGIVLTRSSPRPLRNHRAPCAQMRILRAYGVQRRGNAGIGRASAVKEEVSTAVIPFPELLALEAFSRHISDHMQESRVWESSPASSLWLSPCHDDGDSKRPLSLVTQYDLFNSA